MEHLFKFAPAMAGSLVLAGCVTAATTISETHKLVSAAPIQTEFTTPTTPVSGIASVFWSPATAAATGNGKQYLGYLLIDSGQKCQEFADRLSTAQRGVDTSFDILSGVLSALATAMTPLSTVHALTAAATISTATKSAISADIYAKATASLILQQINNTYYTDIDSYRRDLSTKDPSSIVPALEVSHIQAIHRECSLDSAIASLSQAGTVANASAAAAAGAARGASEARAKNLSPTEGAILGAAVGAAAGAAGPTAAAPATAAQQGAAAAATALAPPAAGGPGAGTAAPPGTGSAGGLPFPNSARPATGPITRTLQPTKPFGSAKSAAEQRMFASEGRKIQRALCIKADIGTVTFGPTTRHAISLFRETTTGQNIAAANVPNIENQGLTPTEVAVLLNAGDCSRQCYANAFEFFEFGPKAGMLSDLSIPPGAREKKLKSLVDLLVWAAKEPPGEQQIKDFCDPATRVLINKAFVVRNIISPENGLSDPILLTLEDAKRKEGLTTQPPPQTPPK